MTLHCFTIPALQPEPAQTELNAFLAQARVVAVHRHFVDDGAASYWAFCIDVTAGPGRLPDALRANAPRSQAGNSGAAVDYKQVLPPDDFALFAGLRDLRKAVAQREGVPVYAVFTNEQLAAMVQQRVRSTADLGAVDGVGQARVQRYGSEFVAWLAARHAEGGATVPPLPADPGRAAPPGTTSPRTTSSGTSSSGTSSPGTTSSGVSPPGVSPPGVSSPGTAAPPHRGSGSPT